ncbi:MAG: DUF3592 domain-containing protein [Ruminococcus sp.]|nr:DUF3592 domain-containing protein [Ruminococcus sp.]
MKKVRKIIIVIYVIIITFLQIFSFYYKNFSPLQLFGSVFLELLSVISVCGIISGINDLYRYCKISKNGISTKAVIKDYDILISYYKTYYPIIEFKDNKKQTQTFKSEVGIDRFFSKYKKGTKLNVRYLSDSPNEFVITPAYLYYSIIEILIFSFFGIPSLIGTVTLIIN